MTPPSMIKYSRRLPVNRSNMRKKKIPKLSTAPAIVAAWSGAIGLSYALNSWSVYDMVAIMPASCAITNAAITMQNGFIVCDWPSSRSFCFIVGNGCGHFWFCLMQSAHDFERSLYSWSSCSSLATTDFGTQPRSHWRAFSASVVRFFASNHIGVSGSYNKKMMVGKEGFSSR